MMPLFMVLIAVFTETARPICINNPRSGAVASRLSSCLREPIRVEEEER